MAKKKVPTKILNYRVIIEKERYPDGSVVYSTSCPTLGVFDYGATIDQTLKSLQDGIEGMVAFLAESQQEIPTDLLEESLVTSAAVRVRSVK